MTEREKGLRLALIEVAAELASRERVIDELRARVDSQAATIEAYREQRPGLVKTRAFAEAHPQAEPAPTEPAPGPPPLPYGVRLKKSGRDLKKGDPITFKKDGAKWNFESVDPQTLSVALSNAKDWLTMTLSDFYAEVLDE